jgi:hypothetical protein
MSPPSTKSRSGIPVHLARKPSRALRISKRSALPFEAKTQNHEAPHWNIPATGGGLGGIETGTQLAFAVMKQRRDPQFQIDNPLQLAEIVKSMMARSRQLESGTEEERYTFSRQISGFMHLITRAMDYYLAGASEFHEGLDSSTMEEILADANLGLGVNSKKLEVWFKSQRSKSEAA